MPTPGAPARPAVDPLARGTAVRRAWWLTGLTLGWNALEAVVALAAGTAAGSPSLVGFGLDSVIETSAAGVLAWRLGQEGRGCTQAADRRATRALAVSFFALAAYVTADSAGDLAQRAAPDASPVGLALAAASLVVMPLLARAKGRLAAPLGSRAVAAEARQTILCAYLSGALLLGLAGNALLGWWRADPLAALVIAGLAAKEGWQAWQAESLADTCCG